MVHDMIEALGGHHYKGHWLADDVLLYKYHIYRIYDVFVPEEDFVRVDIRMAELFREIAKENKGRIRTPFCALPTKTKFPCSCPPFEIQNSTSASSSI